MALQALYGQLKIELDLVSFIQSLEWLDLQGTFFFANLPNSKAIAQNHRIFDHPNGHPSLKRLEKAWKRSLLWLFVWWAPPCLLFNILEWRAERRGNLRENGAFSPSSLGYNGRICCRWPRAKMQNDWRKGRTSKGSRVCIWHLPRWMRRGNVSGARKTNGYRDVCIHIHTFSLQNYLAK